MDLFSMLYIFLSLYLLGTVPIFEKMVLGIVAGIQKY